MNIKHIVFITVAVFAVYGCQDNLKSDLAGGNINFVPSIKCLDEKELTRSSSLVSADGSSEIPLWLLVSDGIDGTSASATKGVPLNTSGSPQVLSNYVSQFFVSGWDGFDRFMPAAGSDLDYDPVTYSGGIWTASTMCSWNGSEDMLFFAYANLPENEDDVLEAEMTSTGNQQRLRYLLLPSDARKQADILMGIHNGAGTADDVARTSTADITFYHPLSAVRFKNGLGDDVKFKSISIDGVYSSGTATMSSSFTGWFSWSGQSGSQKVCLEAEEGRYLTVGEDGIIGGEAFLLIPQSSATTEVSISIAAEVDSAITEYALTINPVWASSGKTYTYILSKEEPAEYIFDVSSSTGSSLLADGTVNFIFNNTDEEATGKFKVKSTKIPAGSSNYTEVKYDAWYSTDGKDISDPSKQWNPFGSGDLELSGLSATGNAGVSSNSYKMPTLTVAARPDPIIISPYKWVSETMRAAAGNELDLSRMAIGGEGNGSAAQNTANCYIVKHPGYYKFPCVYGNSIKDGAPVYATNIFNNTGYVSSAPYKKGGSDGDHMVPLSNVMYDFLNSRGSGIVSEDIVFDLIDRIEGFDASKVKAAMVWCDAKENGELLVHDVAYSGGYISFRTASPANLVQGNAVIAMYYDVNNNGYEEGEALWSWHIWVTDTDLSPENVGHVGSPDSGYYSFMSRYLGWCDGRDPEHDGNQVIRKAAHPRIEIRLKQSEGNQGYRYITVDQNDVVIGPKGDCSYYQAGRKDPFIGCTGQDFSTPKVFYDEQGNEKDWTYEGTGLFPDGGGSNADIVIANSIRYPGTYASNFRYDGQYSNLWSRDSYFLYAGDVLYEFPVIKTVYDPCPYGYHVAPFPAFKSMTITGLDSGSPNGAWDAGRLGFIMKNVEGELDERLFFQFTGVRIESTVTGSNNGHVAGVGNSVDVWTSALYGSSATGVRVLKSSPLTFYFPQGLSKARACAVRPVLDE